MTTTTERPPVDNLVRAMISPEATAVRASSDGSGSTMFGHFAVFNEWTEINSKREGWFLERIAPGAFTETISARDGQIRVLYDHGGDPTIGNKPLGTVTALREDRTGGYYEVELFDVGYVNDLKPAIRSGQVGVSFRFAVEDDGEQWNDPVQATRDNPQMLPERTITKVKLYEFGPVTFPAYEGATVGMRSRTDQFIDHVVNDTRFRDRLVERVGPNVVNQIRASLPPTVEADDLPTTPTAPEAIADDVPTERGETPEESADGGDRDIQARRRWIAARFMS